MPDINVNHPIQSIWLDDGPIGRTRAEIKGVGSTCSRNLESVSWLDHLIMQTKVELITKKAFC
jgi:hypothetical protein